MNKVAKYSVTLDILGKKKTLKGDTLFDIFDQIKPGIVKGKATLKVTKGKLKTELCLPPIKLKRLMINKTFKVILEKRINAMLK